VSRQAAKKDHMYHMYHMHQGVTGIVTAATLCLLLMSNFAAAGDSDDTMRLTTMGPAMRVGPEPYFILVEDFNGDGVADLAIANRGPLQLPTHPQPGNDTVAVLIGRGDGSFHAACDYHVGFAPYTVAGGDFNQDGVVDLAVVCFQSHNNRDLAILHGRGDGTFEPSAFFRVESGLTYDKNSLPDGSPRYASPGLTSLDVVDVDQDGFLDVVAVAWSSDLSCHSMVTAEAAFSVRKSTAMFRRDRVVLPPVTSIGTVLLILW